ncbi:MAG: Por secretion system protein, partial [Bacteroidales bacterium]|nr:Por secretion system protein [Bacteroidales bacterium]
MKKIFLLVLSVIHVFVLQAQIPIGTWRDHLPYNKVIMVADAGSRVYAATPQTIYYVEKAENSMHRLSKIEGLSDVGISAIAYSETYKSLVIAYQNTNVDLLINDVVFNIPDIKRKIIPGKKTINNIEIKDEFAYLSCGFGIIVLDRSEER